MSSSGVNRRNSPRYCPSIQNPTAISLSVLLCPPVTSTSTVPLRIMYKKGLRLPWWMITWLVKMRGGRSLSSTYLRSADCTRPRFISCVCSRCPALTHGCSSASAALSRVCGSTWISARMKSRQRALIGHGAVSCLWWFAGGERAG